MKYMTKTWTLENIRKISDPEKEAVIMDENLVFVLETETNKLKMIFKKAGQRYVQIDITKTIETIVNKLAPHVDVKKLLTEMLLIQSGPMEIMELKERLEKGYAKVKDTPGCYSIMVGGKRGRPYEFVLVT